MLDSGRPESRAVLPPPPDFLPLQGGAEISGVLKGQKSPFVDFLTPWGHSMGIKLHAPQKRGK
jgi:hypothetical protein